MADARHHHATAPTVVLIPYPVPVETPAPEAGSPKIGRIAKPSPFKRNVLEPWRPATKPPRNKAERLVRFLDGWAKQDAAIREYMKPNAALLRAWLERGAVRA
jgi:hypothetical protein